MLIIWVAFSSTVHSAIWAFWTFFAPSFACQATNRLLMSDWWRLFGRRIFLHIFQVKKNVHDVFIYRQYSPETMLESNIICHFKAKMSNIYWYQLVKCEDCQFSLIVNSTSFWLLVRQNKPSEYFNLGFTSFWQFICCTINRLLKK